MSDERQQRYFQRHKNTWILDDAIRGRVTFRKGDLLDDEFPDYASNLYDMDLILCRNTFIYMPPHAVSSITDKFTDTLADGGILVTGHGELYAHHLGKLHSRVFPESIVYQKTAAAFCLPDPAPIAETPHPAPKKPVVASPQIYKMTGQTKAVATSQKRQAAPPASNDEAVSEMQQAWQYANQGQRDKAVKSCDEMVEKKPLEAEPHYLLALLAQERGDFAEARSLLKKVIYLAPSFIAAYLDLGDLYVLKDRLARLMPAIRRTLAEEMGIRNRKLAERTLRDGEEKYRQLFESSRDALMTLAPPTWKFTSANAAILKMFGAASTAEFMALGPWDVSPVLQTDGRPSAEKAQEMIETAMREGSHFFEWEHQHIGGSPFAADVLLTRMEMGEEVFVQATVRDISERKQAYVALNRANRALRTLSAGNLALVKASSEDELLRSVTKVIVENGGYRLAAVCYADDNPEKSLTPMVCAGIEDCFYLAQHLSLADTEQLPVVKTICSGTTQICHDIACDPKFKDPAYKLWRDTALARGYTSNVALPLPNGTKTFGALSIYSSEVGAFDEEEVRLLEELANDLAYGIITLRTRIAHEQQAAILRQSLVQSIQTIADTLEARDPYTAGHQRRVADLATAIAREMCLPEEQVEGIHFAALIHDLGKIHVPAEILAKPGKLTDIEFMLVKTHTQAGYDILKDVKFPWPIAEVVLQHHEKLDGSGYMQGLRDEQILLESKIVTVADVVEAMSSHRPYRPALGIEAALEEIERNRGVQYDAKAVDACIRLFLERGYKLPV